jgi:DNA-binding HxlR family transcriptional regulator
VERRTYPEVPPRVEYTLTAKGEGLVPLIEHMRSYGRDWLVNGNGHERDSIPTPHAVGAASAVGSPQAH